MPKEAVQASIKRLIGTLAVGVIRPEELPCEGINVPVGQIRRIVANSRHACPISVDISLRSRIDKAQPVAGCGAR